MSEDGSTIKRALTALQDTRSKLEKLESAQREPIAVIGLGCRFPGQANSPNQYWQLLQNGVDAISEVPRSRWDINDLYDPNPETPGKMYTRHGGFLERVDLFDPQFFSISPREAASLDPQQRLLLEVSWEALEHANLAPEKLFGSQTGVFVGITGFDYIRPHFNQGLENIDAYFGTGITLSVAAGRLSYFFGFTGPSMSVDTACSSSLVTAHLACQSLRQKECNMALVGGVNVILAPEMNVNFSKARMMAPDGRCKTFDASANGYVRGEGCGILVLKRLSDAQRDGDQVLALIRGSAVNQDGPSGGLTVPNGVSQQRVISQALRSGGIEPDQVSYIEAHGTGTSLGDPIEVEALGEVFGSARKKENPLWAGSVKTNIGHLEGAAGIASLLKVVLMVQHGQIPPLLHFNSPNPHINWDSSPLTIPTSLVDWQAQGQRMAGVSSFGFSGTNAHIVLSEAPPTNLPPSISEVQKRPFHTLALSATKESALQELATRYHQYLHDHPEVNMGDLAHTANTGRSHFHHRLAVTAADTAEMQEKLAAFIDGRSAEGVHAGKVRRDRGPAQIAFLFTGQGAQFSGMGRSLYQTQPVFRQAVDRCAEILDDHLDQNLLDVWFASKAETDLIHETAYTQPALFALEYALTSLWQSWGVEPTFVMGHSVGEYVAACVAGAMSLEEGLVLIARRAQAMQALPRDAGAMAAILASEEQVRSYIAPYGTDLSIAAVNGPRSIVISGIRQAVEDLGSQLETERVLFRPLQVSHAFHSALMEPMLPSLAEAANEVTWHPLKRPLVSNLTGELFERGHRLDAAYWQNHTRQAVQFKSSVETLLAQNVRLFLEIGPRPVLSRLGQQCQQGEEARWIPSLVSGQPDWVAMINGFSQLYVNGADVNWHSFDADYTYQKVKLPTYPFQRRRYWIQGENELMDVQVTKNNGEKPQSEKRPDRQQQLIKLTRSMVAQLLRLEEAEIDSDSSLMEMGADSLILLEAIRIIENQFGIQVTVRQMVEELTTIEALATFLDRELPADWQQQSDQTPSAGANVPFDANRSFYRLQWESLPQIINRETRTGGQWLILNDQTGVGEQLTEHLQGLGQQATILNPGDGKMWEQEIQQALANLSPALTGVIYLEGLDAAAERQNEGAAAVEAAVEYQVIRSLRLIQMLTTLEQPQRPKLWIVTRGAQPVTPGGPAVNLLQAPLWGLGRTCAVEHPEIWGGLIDLDPQAGIVTPQVASLLLDSTSQKPVEDQFAIRGQAAFVPRLVRAAVPAEQPLQVHGDGAYLITGGLKGVGFTVSRWLAHKGAGHLILLGRTPIPERQQWDALPTDSKSFVLVNRLRELERLGATVHYAAVDVTDEQAFTSFWRSWSQNEFPEVRGMIHCASVWQDQAGQSLIRTLGHLDGHAVRQVMRPKVIGSWLIQQLQARKLLDFCVFFSSGAAMFGSAGQGNYAAANLFMDVLAHNLRAEGQAALSINWGAIADIGYGGQEEGRRVHEHWEARGVGRIPADQVINLLERALAGQEAQLGILNMDWERMKQAYPQLQDAAWAARLLPRIEQPASSVDEPAVIQMDSIQQPDRQPAIRQKISETLSQLLHLPLEEVDIHLPFLEMGADSIVLIDAVRHIENNYGIQIAIRQLFEELTTIEAMASYIDRCLPPDWVDPNAVVAEPQPAAPSLEETVSPVDQAAPHVELGPKPSPTEVHPPAAASPASDLVPYQPPQQQHTPQPQQLYQPVAGPPSSGMEQIVQQQLQIMAQQLALLGGGQIQPQATRPVPTVEQPPSPPTSPAPVTPATAVPTTNGQHARKVNGNGSSRHSAGPSNVKDRQKETQAAAAVLPAWQVSEIRARGLSPRQKRHLESLIERFVQRTAKSRAFAETHRPILTDNRASAGFRFSTKEMLYPIVGDRSQGAHLWDIDGNEYIDITMGFGVHLFGHNPPFIKEALASQMESGLHLGPQSHLAGEVAQMIADMTGMERVAFCNSGTEAVMTALRLARATTGRSKVAMFAGSYHGHFDGTIGMAQNGNQEPQAVPIAPGTMPGMLEDVLIINYDDPQSLALLRREAADLAAVLVEPVQSRRPDLQPKGFLQELRTLTKETGAILIFDEMITGFRIHPGGAQAWFDIQADLATYGKIVGGGMPIGVVAGRAQIMDALDGGQWQYGDASYPQADTTFFAGTFCKNPLTMAAAHATMSYLQTHSPSLQEAVNDMTRTLAESLNSFFVAEGVPIQVVYFGSLFRFAFNRNLDLLFYHLLEKGVFIWEGRNYFLSSAHTEDDVAYLIQAVKDSVEELRAGGFLPPKEGQPNIDEDAPLKVISRPFPAAQRTLKAPITHTINGHGGEAQKAANPAEKQAFWGWRQPKQAAKYGGQTRLSRPAPMTRSATDLQFSLFYFGRYESEYRADKYDLLIEGARYADQHDFTAIWAPERHFHSFGGFSPNPSVITAALARETKQIQLRAGSVVLPIHHPIRIVEEWSVVDNLSGGRVGLSFASGWHPDDFVFAPHAFGNHRELMFEGIDIIHALWQGETVKVPSGSGKDVDVKVFPSPVQSELPIWITVVNNPDTYRRAGEIGAGVLTNLMGQSIEDLDKNIQIYRAALAENGYDPQDGHVTVLLHTYIGEDAEQIREEARQPFYQYLMSSIGIFKSLIKSQGLEIDLDRLSDDDREYLLSMAYERYINSTALIGSPETSAPILEHLMGIGVDEIACFIDFGVEKERVLHNLPHLNAVREQFQGRKVAPERRETPQLEPAPSAEREIESLPTCPLTRGQKQLWVLSQMGENGSLAGYPSFAIQMKGPLQISAVEQALQTVVDRHEALRTVIDRDGQYQIVQPAVSIELPLIDLTGTPNQSQEERVTTWLDGDSQEPFDLVKGPLIRANLLRLEPDDHVLIVTTHHIVNDGFSIGVILKEINEIYSATCQGQAVELEAPMQYRDYVAKLDGLKQSGEMAQHEQYWVEKFADAVPILDLPLDRSRPHIKTFAGGRHSSQIDSDLSRKIIKVSGKHGCTLFMTLLGAYMAMLHRLSDQEEIVVGIPAAVRPFEGSENLIGYCTNLLPIRSSLKEQETFADYLKGFRGSLLSDYEHLAYPIISLTEKLKLWRDVSMSPFVSAIFNLERRIPVPNMYNLEVSWFAQPITSAGFELDLNVTRIENGKLVLEWNYNRDIFDQDTVVRWDRFYHKLLNEIVMDIDRPVSQISLLSESEAAEQLTGWNQTSQPLPEGQTLITLFEEQVTKTPDETAVLDRSSSLTYRELDEQVNRFAHYLREQGVGSDSVVAIYLPRSVTMMTALLGVLKAGGAYLPLDPTYPAERLGFMLSDSHAQLLISTEAYQDVVKEIAGDTAVVELEGVADVLADAAVSAPPSRIEADHLAYVIYTSGSTGTPKGAMITHRGLVNYLLWATAEYAGGDSLVHSSVGFDATVTSLYVPLLAGQAVHLLADDEPLEALREALSGEHAYGLIKITPAHLDALAQLLPAKVSAARPTVVIGGDALTGSTLSFWQRHFPKATLVNEYGPTETVVGCSIYTVPGDNAISGPVPIGRPISNTRLYVLDRHQQPVPIGVPGELYIGGLGVARGYLGRPGLTADRFVPDPFGEQPGARMYRSGDIVRALADGTLIYVGRRDNQIKLRGFRIELGEIEAALMTLDEVHEAVVELREDRPGDKRLVAYLVGGKALTPAGLYTALQPKLPAYMIPTAFVELAELPLNENGKVDRSQLPVPGIEALGAQEAYVAPETPTEIALAEIWSEVLGLKQIGVHDDFFHLGGHSLLATQIIARIRETFQVELELPLIFESRTIASMSQVITAEEMTQVDDDLLAQILSEVDELSDEEVMQQLLADERDEG
ncbi:MAG: amino acid adenylation domain-containing protein [Ardenticatenaceae bacterium]|nr:amino acid adenylation domain-containing protein [Ardenticatenaceae bacterium]